MEGVHISFRLFSAHDGGMFTTGSRIPQRLRVWFECVLPRVAWKAALR
jgi:hypothetical protein